jgi:predicted DNA-binding protein YlxM (UPF0122 family)
MDTSEISLYETRNGQVKMFVKLYEETVWLSLNQIAELFNRDKSVVSKHLNNIFKIRELDKKSTVAKFATVQSEGDRRIQRAIEFYNLDAIISVGYRVNSKEGVRFRKWASQILKDHLIQGYTIHEKRLSEKGIKEFEHALELLQRTLTNHELVNDLGKEAIQIILNYSKTWRLLLAYDEGSLQIPTKGKIVTYSLPYERVKDAIETLKVDLIGQGEATEIFGAARNKGLLSILGNIDLTFNQEPL